MKTKKLLSAVALVAWALAGCSSPSPQTSSSTHWVTCAIVADCASVSGAVACTGGFCVDAEGSRLQSADGTEAGATPSTCDPLAPHELPVTLGTILGIGKDDQGTIYVADETESPATGTTDRVFVSSGNTLYRKRIVGSGTAVGTGGEEDYDFSYANDDGSGEGAIKIQTRGGTATAMTLGPPGGKGLGGPDAALTSLAILAPSAIQGMALRNLPGDVDITYAADVANGDVLLVTEPRDDWDGSYRLFYGAPTKIEERTIVNSSESKSGNIDLQFKVGSATYDAATSLVYTGDAGLFGRPGPGTLDTGGGTTIAFTERWPTPKTLPGLSFTCF